MTISAARKVERVRASRIVPDKSVSTTAKPEEVEATQKKRRRVSPKQAKEAKTTSISQPPSHILVIDNGGDTLKYGLVTADRPDRIPNLTAKLKLQWTVLIGDKVTQIQPNQVEHLTRSTERSHINNLGNQVQVWKRILDLMRIQVPLTSDASQVFGWKNNRANNEERPLYSPQQMAVLVLVAPFCPRSTIESMYSVWFDDFQFGRVGFASSAIFAAVDTPTQCSCVVDLGWSATHVVPTFNKNAIVEGIRRIPIGGRHMVNLWKYYMSYRQLNMMDSEFILRDLHEQLSYLSMDFIGDMKSAQQVRSGKRLFDCDFVLPDFQSTFTGSVRRNNNAIEEQEIKILTQKSADTDKEFTGKDDKSETVTDQSGEETNDGDDNKENGDHVDDNDEEDDDEVESEEEDEEHRKRRILRQRADDARRKKDLEGEEQVLQVSVERFAIPEVLFHPSDAGFPPEIAGLPQAVAQSIMACPKHYQAALFGSIILVGGMSKLPNMQERLERDLRALAPTQYDVKILIADSPGEQAWKGASTWVQGEQCDKWSITKEEHDASKKHQTKPWRRLCRSHGGSLI